MVRFDSWFASCDVCGISLVGQKDLERVFLSLCGLRDILHGQQALVALRSFGFAVRSSLVGSHRLFDHLSGGNAFDVFWVVDLETQQIGTSFNTTMVGIVVSFLSTKILLVRVGVVAQEAVHLGCLGDFV